MHFDLPQIIKSLGYFGVWGIIFAESGLLIGFFLPGDSLLFTAGFVASQNLLNIWILIIGAFVFAVLGDNVGYMTGNRFGRRLFQKEDSWLFRKKHLAETTKFYQKYGKKTIVLARFVPIVRTFAPIIAGIGAMNYRTFMTYNLAGGFLWTFGITLLGFFLGKSIPAEQIDKYLFPIIGIIIVLSLLPSIVHIIQENKKTRS
ncbi:VTT domain-containing protein [Aetokthonos hydrillicola Thurmond2011]|uniref:VTT domain-containing protein n=1 Tax=Aetokthonos hydrillicola Thurmond2011 TaxID=2712845 RepID=A0AAP5M6C8_9CYAN|nr:VTT domain-containing protein [Aetokthonos hydrillicola]MBO3457334.1 DedA family protein [Aetokthonos hydrillicola CCALA 1050]MBW4586683.1 VTT domain-containing protein [Aetokthonos hydrillicola CCALA 1050]MDR9893990.1 VTT domain-containing protein [Aetokthonos hydrillicola Thurmond2011]